MAFLFPEGADDGGLDDGHVGAFEGVGEPLAGVMVGAGDSGDGAGGFEDAVAEAGVAEMAEADFGDVDSADEAAELSARGPDAAALDAVGGHGFADEVEFAVFGEEDEEWPVAEGQVIDPGREAWDEVVAKDDGGGVDVVEAGDAGEAGDEGVGGVGEGDGGGADFVADFDLVEAETAGGMGGEVVDLELEFGGVGPVVVAFEEGDVLAAGGGVELREVGMAADVDGGVEGADAVGEAGGEGVEDAAGVVGRGVIADEDFDGEGSDLGEGAFEGLGEERFVIEGGNQNADERGGMRGRAHALTGRAGTPKTVWPRGTLFKTTEPAPTVASSSMTAPGRMQAWGWIVTQSPMTAPPPTKA